MEVWYFQRVEYEQIQLHKKNGSIYSVETDYEFGYQFSAIAEYAFNENFSLRFSPGYARKESEVKMMGYKDINKSNYILLPINIKYKFNLKKVTPYITGGISINILLDSYYDSFMNTGKKSIKDKMNKSFYSIEANAGCSFNVSSNIEIFGEAGLSIGLNVISKNDGADAVNKTLAFNIGAMIEI